MFLSARIYPKSGKSEIIIDEQQESAKIYVKSPPEGGKANKEAIRLIAKHYNAHKMNVHLVSGHKSRQKVFEIDD